MKDEASAAREPAQGREDLRVLGGSVRRLRRQVDRLQGRGDRLPHGARHAEAAAGAVPREPRDLRVRHRQPEGRREVGRRVRQAPGGTGPSSSSSGSRTRTSCWRRTPTTGAEGQGQARRRPQHQGQLAAAGRPEVG